MDDNTDRPTKLSELTSFIKNFFKTKAYVEPDPDFGEEGRWEYPKLQQQQFFFGQQDDHLYGFKAAKVPETVAGRQRNAFVKKLGNPDVFSTVVDSCW